MSTDQRRGWIIFLTIFGSMAFIVNRCSESETYKVRYAVSQECLRFIDKYPKLPLPNECKIKW